ncbi:hypothetical protein BH10BAC5_BH10BAC5_06420 [soil metagenome]
MHRISKLLILLAIILIIPAAVSAKIYLFSMDYAQFRGSNGKTKLEIYSSFLQKSIKYTYKSGKFTGKALLQISFYDVSKGSTIFNQTYSIPVELSDTSSVKLNENMIVKLDYLLLPGTYKIQGIGSDGDNSNLTDTISYDVTIDSFESTHAQISDIQFATSISNSKDTSSLFYKNTLEVLPNPNNLFGNKLKDIFYYIELYDLNSLNLGENINVDISILDANQKQKYKTNKILKKGSDSRVDIGKFAIDSFPSGSYILQYSVVSGGVPAATANKKFYIYNSGINSTVYNDDNTNDFLKSEFGSMTSENADMEFEKLLYIITPAEKDYYKKLSTVEDKRKFLYTFWKARNNNSISNVRLNFFKRLNEANNQFSESFKDGWKSDRGRIYVLYGKPDNVDRFPFESSSHAYEIWHYDNLEGGAEVDFVERESSTGIYTIVNSTLKNEVKFPEWRTFYKITGF